MVGLRSRQNKMEKAIISGVALNKNEAQVMVVGVPDRPGIANEILGPVAQKNIEVDMIVQNSGANGAPWPPARISALLKSLTII